MGQCYEFQNVTEGLSSLSFILEGSGESMKIIGVLSCRRLGAKLISECVALSH